MCSIHLICCLICIVALCLLVLPYSCFTRRWACSPYSRQTSTFGFSAEEEMLYDLSWEGISTPKLLYSLYIVTQKMKLCGQQVQFSQLVRWWYWQGSHLHGPSFMRGGGVLRWNNFVWWCGWWSCRGIVCWALWGDLRLATLVPTSCGNFMRKFNSVKLGTCLISELPHEVAKFLGEMTQMLQCGIRVHSQLGKGVPFSCPV